jgi:hypothetical protein
MRRSGRLYVYGPGQTQFSCLYYVDHLCHTIGHNLGSEQTPAPCVYLMTHVSGDSRRDSCPTSSNLKVGNSESGESRFVAAVVPLYFTPSVSLRGALSLETDSVRKTWRVRELCAY